MIGSLIDNNLIASLLAFALILIPAVIIHELGHFFAAKWVGINVLEFGIGFPPRAMRLFVWGETEFTLNWLPIGGFVRPLGEDMIGPVSEEDGYDPDKPKHGGYLSEREELIARGVPEDKLMSVNDAKPLPRIFFMVAGALANFASAFIFFIVSALFGLPEDVGGRMQLIDIPEGSIFAIESVASRDYVELIDGEYFAGHVEFFEILQRNAGSAVALTMRSDETGENYEIVVTPDLEGFSGQVLVTAIVEGSPADQVGMQPGDAIAAINGERVPTTDSVGWVIERTNELAGTEMTLTLQRMQELIEIGITPRVEPPPQEGRMGIIIDGIFRTSDGVSWYVAPNQQELFPQPLDVAIAYGFNRTMSTLNLIAGLPGQIINGTISPEEARPVSIVGISQIGGAFLQQSVRDGTPGLIFEFIALISIFLGATNLLPFPPLDGGRILFVIIEMVRGKPVPPRIEALVYQIGIGLLLALGLVVILYDIFNPITIPS